MAAPRPVADPVRVPFRGAGRPAFLTSAAAAVLLTGAGLAVGVTTGPTASAGGIAGHSRLTSDAGAPSRRVTAGLGQAGRVARSSAATGIAYPVPTEPAQPGSRQRAGQRTDSKARSGTARSARAARPAQHGQPTAAPSPSVTAAPEQPIEIYDSAAPAAIPAGVMVATYATGKFAVSGAAMAGRPTLWIDAWGTDPAASALDVEPGDATPSMVPAWVTQHLALDPSANARIYTMLDEWPAVQQAVSTLPASVRARIRWWIADPTGVPHMVPGASATQWYWGPSYDISTADPGF